MVHLYIVNFNLDKNDNVKQTHTHKKMMSGASLQTKTKTHTHHAIITISVWKSRFHIDLLWASPVSSLFFKTSVCQNQVVNDFLMPDDNWSKKKKRNNNNNGEKTCFKVPWRPFQPAVRLRHTAAWDSSRIAVHLWRVCLRHNLLNVSFFLLRCRLVLLIFNFLFWFPAPESVRGSVYKLLWRVTPYLYTVNM